MLSACSIERLLAHCTTIERTQKVARKVHAIGALMANREALNSPMTTVIRGEYDNLVSALDWHSVALLKSIGTRKHRQAIALRDNYLHVATHPVCYDNPRDPMFNTY